MITNIKRLCNSPTPHTACKSRHYKSAINLHTNIEIHISKYRTICVNCKHCKLVLKRIKQKNN